MKLVIDIRMINASGIGTYLKNILPEIIISFDEVIVLGNKREILQFDWSNQVEIIQFNAKIYSIKEQFFYPFIIPKCDVFWCPHFNFPILPFFAAKKIVTIHDVNHLTGVSSFSVIKKRYASLLFNNAVKKTNLIFTVSEFSKKELIKYTAVDPEKIKVVYCGVNRSLFSSEKNNKNLKLPENYILYVGNIKPHKNLITLLKAYNNFSNEFKSKFKLLIVGEKEGFITKDNLIDNYINKNSLEKMVLFSGHVSDSDLPTYYQNASLFVFPSLYEGFGLPILEALAAKTIIISSNAASLPEIGGEAVIYFDPTNEVELYQKIKECLENRLISEKEMQKRTIQLDKFTWEKSIKNHLDAFNKILNLPTNKQ